jgi:tripartite-type tricarboxylate transporter receptor subunit TctC
MKHIHAICTALLVAGILSPSVSVAQNYPTRSIKIVVPFTAGGGVDTVARLLGDSLKGPLGQSIVVENLPGASGMRGAETVARAEPDGYTLLLASAGEIAVNAHLFKGIKYKPLEDLAPITLVVKVPNILVVNAASSLKSLDDLIALTKKSPDKVSYSSSGIGNPQHLAGELFNRMASVKMTHVPYRGAAQQVTDVLGNNVTATFASYLAVSSFVEGGQVRALGVTSQERIPNLGNTPAIAEHEQLKGYDVVNWFGLFVPAKTPPAVVETLNKAVVKILSEPEVIKKLETLGAFPSPMTPAQFKEFVASETKKFGDIVVTAGIKAE